MGAVLVCLFVLALIRFVVGIADKLSLVCAVDRTPVTRVVEPCVDVIPKEEKPITDDAVDRTPVTLVVEPCVDVSPHSPKEDNPMADNAVDTNSNASKPSLEAASSTSGNSVVVVAR